MAVSAVHAAVSSVELLQTTLAVALLDALITEGAKEAAAEIVPPPDIVIVEPSGLTTPRAPVVAVPTLIAGVDPPLLTIGAVPVTAVTVPPPLGVVQAPEPLRYVELLHDPLHRPITSDAAASLIAPVVVVFLTIPVPRVAQF